MKRAQSITEYAIFIAAVIMAFLAIKAYFSRGYSGYAKKYTDSLGKNQYSPAYSNYDEIKESGLALNSGDPLGPSSSISQKGLNLTAQQKSSVEAESQVLYGLYDQWLNYMTQNDSVDAAAVLARMQTEKRKIDQIYSNDYAGKAYSKMTGLDSQITRTIGGAVSNTTLSSQGSTFSGLKSFGGSLSADDGITDSDYAGFKDFKDNFDNLPADYNVKKQGTVTDDFSGKKLSEDQLFTN